MSTPRRCGRHEEWETYQVSDTVLHRTCKACGEIEEDVFVRQGHTVTIVRSPLGGLIWACTCRATGSTSARDRAFDHVERDDSGGEDDGVVVADAGHTFRISVEMRGSSRVYGEAHHRDTDHWAPVPNRVEVRAWSLKEALEKAAELPFPTWFEGDEDP